MDYYKTLGLKKSANASDIKSAYRRLAKEHHPDRGGDPETFKSINEAYSILIDTNKRAEYDYVPQQDFKFNSNNFNDIFKDIFGASAGFHHSQYSEPKNKNIRAKIEVTIDTIFEDQSRAVHLNTGRSEKTLLVNIPAGVNDGATIRYPGYGQDILTRAPAGDLLVTIHVKDTINFSRKGKDIYSHVDVDAIDAILGSDLVFEHIDRSRINIKIPPGTQQAQILRISGKGLPFGNSTIGNLMLTVNIKIPKNLSEQKQQLLNQYKDL